MKGQLWGQLITEMKLIHISDLHLGKRIYDFSMTDEQEYILNEIIAITDREKPEALIIAGDIYDKSVPSSEAVLIIFCTSFLKEDLRCLLSAETTILLKELLSEED